VSDKRLFVLAHTEARKRALAAVAEATEGFVVRIEPPRRNLDQNAALHAKITEIAGRMEWCGKHWDAETWKRLLVGAWTRAINEPVMMLPALDGHGVEIVFRRTSNLTKRECSDLLEWINAWAAENVPEAA
jgi:NinB protein